MAQSIGGFYSVLRLPWAYSAFQRVIARRDARRILVDNYIKPVKGDRVVDIGCGPGVMLSYLKEVDYVGVDIDPHYITNAQKQYGNRGRFIQGDVSDVASEITEQVDVVLAIALLHHLDDEQAHALLRSAVILLRPGGRLITFDCVRLERQNLIARLLIEADRGKNTRTSAQYEALAKQSFSFVECHIHNDLLRLPYNHFIMVCHKLR